MVFHRSKIQKSSENFWLTTHNASTVHKRILWKLNLKMIMKSKSKRPRKILTRTRLKMQSQVAFSSWKSTGMILILLNILTKILSNNMMRLYKESIQFFRIQWTIFNSTSKSLLTDNKSKRKRILKSLSRRKIVEYHWK